MFKPLHLRVIFCIIGLVLGSSGFAANRPESRGTPWEAYALFHKAVSYMEANGPEQAFAAFNDSKGEFVTKDLYVYVIDKAGVYKATGAAGNLVGSNVLDIQDAAGQPIIKNMLAAVKQKPESRIAYQWLNRKSNRVEPKVAFLRAVGDYVLGVGFYMPRSTRGQALAHLDRAVAEIQRQGLDAAKARFDDPHGEFTRGDLYVFVIDAKTGLFVAGGLNPALAGTDARTLTDVEGKRFVNQMLRETAKKGQAEVSYMWLNPLNNVVEKKHSLVKRVDHVMVGVGYYTDK